MNNLFSVFVVMAVMQFSSSFANGDYRCSDIEHNKTTFETICEQALGDCYFTGNFYRSNSNQSCFCGGEFMELSHDICRAETTGKNPDGEYETKWLIDRSSASRLIVVGDTSGFDELALLVLLRKNIDEPITFTDTEYGTLSSKAYFFIKALKPNRTTFEFYSIDTVKVDSVDVPRLIVTKPGRSVGGNFSFLGMDIAPVEAALLKTGSKKKEFPPHPDTLVVGSF